MKNLVQETLEQIIMKPWVIYDWAGNLMDFERFESFEDFLSEKLDENYETDRCEYYIELDTKKQN